MKGVIVLAASMLVLSSTGFAFNLAQSPRIVVSTSPIESHFDNATYREVLQEARQIALANGYSVVDANGKYVTLRGTVAVEQAVKGKMQNLAPKSDKRKAAQLSVARPSEALATYGRKEVTWKTLARRQFVGGPILVHLNQADLKKAEQILKFDINFHEAAALTPVEHLLKSAPTR